MNAAFLITLALAGAPERELVDRIVAVVNEDVVTLSELKAAAKMLGGPGATSADLEKLYPQTLDQLIADRLLNQQIAEAKIDISDEEVERAIDDICRQNNITRDQLQQAVEQRGLSMGQYREDLKKQLIRLKIVDLKVRSRVVIPEADIRAEYESQVALETREELVRIRHIFFRWGESPDPEERTRVIGRAEAAKKRVLAGEKFEDVAKEVSESPTASAGGDLGEMPQKSLLPELAQALVNLEPEQLSNVVETPSGVHVVFLVSKRMKGPETYESMKTKIYQQLYQQETDRQMKVWIDELRGLAAVQVRL